MNTLAIIVSEIKTKLFTKQNFTETDIKRCNRINIETVNTYLTNHVTNTLSEINENNCKN